MKSASSDTTQLHDTTDTIKPSREEIIALAETLTHLSVTYRYPKARAILNKQYAESQQKSKREWYNKRYHEDEAFREQKLAMNAKYLPALNEKLRNKYHTDEEYRQKKLAQNRAYNARKRAEQREAKLKESTV